MARQVYDEENTSCASDNFSQPESAPKLKTQGNRFPCGLLGEISGSETRNTVDFNITIGPCRLMQHIHWLKFMSIISTYRNPAQDSFHFRLCCRCFCRTGN